MMHRRSTRTGLPIPNAVRFGRSRSRRRHNIGPMPRQNGDNGDEPEATLIAQHPAERDSTPDQSRQNVATRAQTGVSHQAAQPQSP